jgi:two-component system sensor histidine kinase/response regulator
MDGTPFDASVSLKVIHYGERQLLVSSIRDISERKALERESALHKHLFDWSPDPIGVLENGVWITANDAYAQLFGLEKAADLIGRNPGEFSPAVQPEGRESGEKAMELMGKAVEDGEVSFYWNHLRNGSEFEAEIHIQAFEFEGRKLLQSTARETPRSKAQNAGNRQGTQAEES